MVHNYYTSGIIKIEYIIKISFILIAKILIMFLVLQRRWHSDLKDLSLISVYGFSYLKLYQTPNPIIILITKS